MRRFCCVFFVLITASMSAHGREWSDKSGVFSVEADLISFDGATVRLRKTNGSIIKVPLAKLSESDQSYLTRRNKTEVRGKSLDDLIREALRSPTKMDFVELPLSDVVRYLSELHNVPIRIDLRALEDVGIDQSQPITANRQGELARALDIVLETVDLSWTVRHDSIIITTPEAAENDLLTRVYAVNGTDDLDGLIEGITQNVAPDSWDEVGGPGSISAMPRIVVISQTLPVLRKVEKHYGNFIKQVRGKTPAPKTKVASILEKPALVQFVETPLEDVAKFLSSANNVEIGLDERAMDDYGIGKDVPITGNMKGIRLRSILSLLLAPLELTWIVDDDRIVITTPEDAETKLQLVGYSIEDFKQAKLGESLVDMIITMIEPSSWDEVGGPATARVGVRGTLDVRQTTTAHYQIDQLLADTRAAMK